MTAFKMPPLPEPADNYYVAGIGTFDAYTEGQMHAYGRAVLEAVHEMVRNISVTGGQVHMRQAILDELRAAAKEQA